MSGRATFHGAFTAALVDPRPDAVPADLDMQSARRFAVYRNNVHRGLGEALKAAYPVVCRLVGDEFFFAMARLFASQERKRSASLALYGAGFADFIDGFAPAASVPYLGDVARLERAWLEAYNAADATPLDIGSLSEAGDRIDQLCFVAHPAARIVASPFPILQIWQANRQGAEGGAQLLAQEQCVLVTRPELSVELGAIEPSAFGFAQAMLEGRSAQEAIALAESAGNSFDVSTVFHRLITAGAFSQIAGD